MNPVIEGRFYRITVDPEATIELPHGEIHSASLCNSVENDVRPRDVAANKFELKFRPREVLTVRLMS